MEALRIAYSQIDGDYFHPGPTRPVRPRMAIAFVMEEFSMWRFLALFNFNNLADECSLRADFSSY